MGKLSNSLLSGSFGRTGRLVVANVNGTEILKHRPRKPTGNRNQKQLLIQQRMVESYNFLSAYKHFATKFFGRKNGMRSAYNMAMSNIMSHFQLDFTLMQISILYPGIAFAKGSLLQPVITGLVSAAGNSFTIEWLDNSAGNALRQTDLVQILYALEGETSSVFIENVATRADGAYTAALPPAWAGQPVHVWMGFLAADLEGVSNSVYAGSVVIS